MKTATTTENQRLNIMVSSLQPSAASKQHSRFKEPGSAITHLIGAIMSIFASVPLFVHAWKQSGSLGLISMIIFMSGMILLYTASTLYHSIDSSESINKRLKKFDHLSISLLIAGSYTPVCLLVLPEDIGRFIFLLVWGTALAGMILKLCWIHCPKWVSSVIYIAMGWICLLAFPQIIQNLSTAGFLWLLAGGLIYTMGGIIYALKLPIFNNKHKNFGSHEIFHLFVMGGSICHYIFMFQYVLS